MHTTYGYDLIQPELLKNKTLWEEKIGKILSIIKKSKYSIPKSVMVGRLLVMTKTGSPIAPIDKTRPIAVQSLAIRIIEKIIK